MNEQFLQYLWKFRLLSLDLHTAEGAKLTVLHPGIQNNDGGPDFFNARVRINQTVWAGNVELHMRSSDWIRHRHQYDPAYENVILHVVYENDQAIRQKHQGMMATLEVKNNFPAGIVERYREIMQNHLWIPCYKLLNGIAPGVMRLWAPALAAERLNVKSGFILRLLDEYADWDEVLYILLASGFGFRINSLPFELLARSVPLRIVRRNADNPFRLEAVFYGQSGLLAGNPRDKYLRSLHCEYRHQQAKFGLKPLKPGLWKRLRLHPSNFPDIRISQFVQCLVKCKAEPGFLLQSVDALMLEEFFQLSASAYWDTHYRFGKTAGRNEKKIGPATARLLLINVLAPFLFAYGSARDMSPMRMRAVELLEGLEAESNHESRMWNSLGINAENALESQALIQLKRNYCDYKRCLECRIGLKLLDKHNQP
ncbi:MAG: DUF2851 family protein [Bacteroidetes bacterium]|nr:DUF2851 family protein [Bacteroidota bacterium]